ncbi:excinuclease ABC subunit UvrB [Maridesulfovibrio frigidus]|uniref:excinuclease ABC subunit UvrB n=1 Tax=Maridesulfovibrio frigidus TaxID=340956 RepID=UPI0004E13121|nr:excinuclease ABC subunit UvrB [Maridesulfovibrio frigidus]
MSGKFELVSDFTLKGDQPEAVKQLVENLKHGVQDQVLLGATGTGKTFAMANVISQLNRPTLVMAPNKTLAAQLFNEFKTLFPNNAVEYFVSYYDYYQPEAYLPHSDTFIEKDSSINDDIDKLRHSATHALLTRRDVLIVASVSCIYGLGSPEFYSRMIIPVEEGQDFPMEKLMDRLIEVQYVRNDYDFHRGTFRVRGDVIEIIPAYSREQALRIEYFGDEIEAILETDPLTGEVTGRRRKTVIYPASHFVSDKDNLETAVERIRAELFDTLNDFKRENKLVEAQRIEQRTMYDLEMIEEIGYCSGIENYSRQMDGREEGDPPATLLHYFPDDFLLFMDESHIAVSQVGAMYNGDRSRKTTLVNFGFRLPSALDNRPLCFDEFLDKIGQTVYVSATPGPWEIERAEGLVIEQIIRPTGLLDPLVEVRPSKAQMDDLLAECKIRESRNERVLITTLTKRMSEDLTDYFNQMGVEAKYLHSDIVTMERMEIIQSLRAGDFTALVGINLLREGLDIPEVSLVAILDADKEGFLRSNRSLIQTFGRAARNSEGLVILYADRITNSMRTAMDETARRRLKQIEYNKEHGITPQTISKSLDNMLGTLYSTRSSGDKVKFAAEEMAEYGLDPVKMEKMVRKLEKEMRKYASELEFEKAAELRDRIQILRNKLITLG